MAQDFGLIGFKRNTDRRALLVGSAHTGGHCAPGECRVRYDCGRETQLLWKEVAGV